MRKSADLAAPRRSRTDATASSAAQQALTSSHERISQPVLHDRPVIPEPPPSVDHLRFRLVTRRGKHYFKDVRYKGPLTLDTIAVVKYFEGRCLENLTPATLGESFPLEPILPQIEKLVRDLRQVLVD
ncbi:MAG TPA: hypothetical protein VEJ63_20185 [Planctomycetota bacterium]|nr:hypothetical protein [Planctomycetota bacterium]